MSISLLIPMLFFQAGAAQTIDVCSGAELTQSGIITMRGTGGISREGTMLFDYTCPVGEGNGFTLPTVVLIVTPAFADQAIAKQFQALPNETVYQARVEGRLECRNPLRLRRSDDGDIVSGSGYGELGLYKCVLRDARILSLRVIGATPKQAVRK